MCVAVRLHTRPPNDLTRSTDHDGNRHRPCRCVIISPSSLSQLESGAVRTNRRHGRVVPETARRGAIAVASVDVLEGNGTQPT